MGKVTLPLRVTLLGRFTLQEDGVELPLPTSAHARFLLAYLCLNPSREFPRPVLAGLLSPEASEESARKTLNQSLWYIRRSLPGLVNSDPERVSLSPDYPLEIDVFEFEAQVAPDAAQTSRPLADLRRLKSVIALYRGDLLEGNYEDWVLAERERLRELFLQALEHLSQALRSVEDYEQALNVALRLVQADPLRESAHREVMRLHHLLGHPELSLKQYQACQRLLQDELGLDPEPETVALAREISRRSTSSQAPYLPDANSTPGESPLERNAPGQLPLIGRSLDKQALLALVEPEINCCGTIAVIEGEPGIGKTRLLNEVRRDLEWHGVQVVEGKASEMDTEPQGGTVLRALKTGLLPLRVEQIRSLASPEELPALAWILTYLQPQDFPAPPQDNSSTRDPHQVIRHGLVVLLSLWAQVTPLVIALDDFHWAGEDAWEMLLDLAAALLERQSVGISFLVSLRPLEAQARPYIQASLKRLSDARLLNRVELRPLNLEATGQLIRGYLGVQQPQAPVEARLYREAGGNPLFTLESLRLLYEASELVRGKTGAWEIKPEAGRVEPAPRAISPTIEIILTRRLAQLLPSACQILKTLAVIGDACDLPMLRVVFPQDLASLFTDLHQLVQAHFLTETAQEYRFSHDTLRQAAYASLAEADRIRLHARIGGVLEVLHPGEVGALAYHFHRGQLWEQAVACYQKVGLAAYRLYRYHQAESAFSEAISLAALAGLSPQGRLDLLALREKVLHDLGERDRQWLDLQAMRRLIHDANLGTECYLQWLLMQANYLIVTSKYAECESLARQGLALAETSQDPLMPARLRCLIGYALHGAGHDSEAILYLTSVIPMFHASGDRAKESEILRALTVIHADASRYDLARQAVEAAIELDRQLGDRTVLAKSLWLIGWILLEQGDFDQAESACRESLEISRSLGDRYVQVSAESVEVDLLIIRGEIGPAFELFEHAIGLCRYLKEEKLQISLLADFTDQIMRFLGDLDQAARVNQAAEALARKQRMPVEQALCAATGSYIAFQNGKRVLSRRHIEKTLAVLRDNERPGAMISLQLRRIELELAVHRPRIALSCLLEAEDLASKVQVGMLALELLANRCAVMLALGRNEEALQASSAAMQMLRPGCNSAYGIPYCHYQALTACGQYTQALQALTQAVQMLSVVLNTFTLSQQKTSRAQVQLHRDIFSAWEGFQPRREVTPLPALDGSGEILVEWTLWLPEDQAVQDKVQRRRSQLQRLLQEAARRGADPTHHQLIQALKISERTLAQDLAALRKKVSNES